MSRNLGALTSWNAVGLFRPVMGHLYLYLNTNRKVKMPGNFNEKVEKMDFFTKPKTRTPYSSVSL
jgi:hypothetical protein